MSSPPYSSSSQTLRPGQFYGRVIHQHVGAGIILAELKHEQASTLPAHSHKLASFQLLLYGYGSETTTLKPFTTIFHPSGVTHHDEIGSGVRIFSV